MWIAWYSSGLSLSLALSLTLAGACDVDGLVQLGPAALVVMFDGEAQRRDRTLGEG
jgi:hypothetical protein